MSLSTSTKGGLTFGKFLIQPTQIFYRSPKNLSAAIVNLKPIVPGHVLVLSTRIVPRLHQLSTEEYTDLFATVRIVQNKIEKYYGAKGSNVAVQDGKVAGQSVFHVHVHILPRVEGDFERNDDVYDALEAWDPNVVKGEGILNQGDDNKGRKLEVPEDEDRKPRTMEMMMEEATLYRGLFQNQEE